MESTALSIPQVAERLGVTPNGVYKLIQRGRLAAERTSARRTHVRAEVLEAFIAEQQAAVNAFRAEQPPVSSAQELRENFERHTSHSPEDWLAAWKSNQFEDTPENTKLLARAAALSRPAGTPALVEQPAAAEAFAFAFHRL